MFEYDKEANALVEKLDRHDLKHFLMYCWRIGTNEIHDIFYNLMDYIRDDDPALANGLEDYWSSDELEIYLRDRYKINFYEEIHSYMCRPNLYNKEDKK